MVDEATVFVVDDDQAVRKFLKGLIETIGLRVETFPSASEFLEAYDPESPGCVVLDIRMPGMSGLELQRILVERQNILPVIILTGHGDVALVVASMKSGAVDFIEKPFNNEVLLDRIQSAVAKSTQLHEQRHKRRKIECSVELLTPRERQVLDLIVDGETNKGIARKLDISEKTVEIHRARVMEKMNAKSLASLVKMTSEMDGG